MMHWPTKLNVDVLAIICESLNDDSDVLSFFLTCSTLLPIAIRNCFQCARLISHGLREDFVLLETRSWLRYARSQSLQKAPIMVFRLGRSLHLHNVITNVAPKQDCSWRRYRHLRPVHHR